MLGYSVREREDWFGEMEIRVKEVIVEVRSEWKDMMV